MLLVIGISIVVVMVLLITATNSLKYVREIQVTQRLQAEGDYLINKLAYWIRQGKQLPTPGTVSAELEITLTDDSKKIFKKDSDNKVILETRNAAGTLISSEVLTDKLKITNSDIFTTKVNAVKINLVTDSNFFLKTILAKRNF